MTADYSVTPAEFYVAPPENEIWLIRRMIASIEDASGATAAEYGNLGLALPNGISPKVYTENGTILDLVDGDPITTNSDWAENCFDVQLKTWGAGNEKFVIRWSFFKDNETGVLLIGRHGHRLGITANDDFTGLVSHNFHVRGRVIKR